MKKQTREITEKGQILCVILTNVFSVVGCILNMISNIHEYTVA